MKRRKASKCRHTTISHRLVLCFLLSTLIPAVCVTCIICAQFIRKYEDTAQRQMEISCGLVSEQVNMMMVSIDNVTIAPYYHSYFTASQAISREDENYAQEVSAFQKEMQTLFNLTNFSRSDVNDLIVWTDGMYLYRSLYNELWYSQSREYIEQQPWFTRAMENSGRFVITPTNVARESEDEYLPTDTFYVSRRINNIRLPKQQNMVLINMTTHSMEKAFQDMNLLYDSFVVLTNNAGELVYSSKPLTKDALTQVVSGEDFSYDNCSWISMYRTIPGYPIEVRVVYSLDAMHRSTLQLIINAALVYLAGFGFAMLLFYSMNRWIRRSASNLTETFRQLENGDLQARCPDVEVVEFNQIGISINNMIRTLDEKIQNEYLMAIRQKNLELYALRAQIQPHFLINTVYCLLALNQIGEHETLNDMFYRFASLLQYVLSRETLSTLGEEADFLGDYLQLQQLRFGQRLNYSIQVPQQLRNTQIPRLILQPLVENAVLHGIEPCSHPCTCWVKAEEDEQNIVMTVSNDGVMFNTRPAESVTNDEIIHKLKKGSGASIGLYYIRERLRHWSPGAKLEITGGVLTVATITIPKEGSHNDAADCR